MGKDGSGEPASKKFKQSQLCFKSPKANGLKIKVPSPVKNETVCKSEKLHSPESSVVSSEQIKDKPSNVPSCDEKSNSVNSKVVATSPSSKSSVVNSEADVDNVRVGVSDKENSISESNKGDVNKIVNVPMDVDPPSDDATSEQCLPAAEKHKGSIENETVKEVIESSMDTSTSDSLPKNEDSKETASENTSDLNSPSKGDKSVLTDVSVTSVNETLSPCVSISSDSDDEGDATSSGSAPVTPKTPKRQMTPKMLKRHEESVKKKQLLEQQKKEKQARREQLKNEKLKMKMEEEEKKKQMKEERKKKRLAEIELKNEEKRLKQEDKRQRKEKEEEERKRKKDQKTEEMRKEEEKKEQEKKKEEKTQAAFVNFFQKKQVKKPAPVTSPDDLPTFAHKPSTESSGKEARFMPFHVKEDMKLCNLVRRELTEDERETLTKVLKGDVEKKTYLEAIKDSSYITRCSPPTWPAPVSEELHDCIVIEAQVEEPGAQDEETGDGKSSKGVDDLTNHTKTTRRAKLLQFCENRRPAYFGTWTKHSKQVSGRNPFAKDDKGLLDYEVDSDSEWEEEEEGEDLESVKDDDNEGQEEEVKEGENGYLLDNTFVPHGYLSDEEQADEEDIHESVEKQKDRLVALKEEFDEEMKEGGAQALKPKLLGCLWVSNSTTQVSKGSLYEVLLSHRAVWEESSTGEGISMEPDSTPCPDKSPTQTPSAKQLPPIVLQEIARMVDGSRWPLSKLVREVGEVLTVARPQNPVSRLALTRAIKQMASKTLDSKENSVWTIKAEFRSEYHLQELEEVPLAVTPSPRVKGTVKETLLDNFLRSHQQKSDQLLGAPPAKKRISLTPVSQPPTEEKMVSTHEEKKAAEAPVAKKKVAFVTLPPRTPGTTPQNRSIPRTPGPWSNGANQSSLKPHVDTPRPSSNKFLLKASPAVTEVVEISDDSNL